MKQHETENLNTLACMTKPSRSTCCQKITFKYLPACLPAMERGEHFPCGVYTRSQNDPPTTHPPSHRHHQSQTFWNAKRSPLHLHPPPTPSDATPPPRTPHTPTRVKDLTLDFFPNSCATLESWQSVRRRKKKKIVMGEHKGQKFVEMQSLASKTRTMYLLCIRISVR